MMVYYVGFSGEIIIKGELFQKIEEISPETIIVHEISENLLSFLQVPSLQLFNSAEDLANLIISDPDLYLSSEKDLIIVYPIGLSFSLKFLSTLNISLRRWNPIKVPGWLTFSGGSVFIVFQISDLVNINNEIFS